MIINHQRNKFKGGKSSKTWKKELAREMEKDCTDYELDHIIPYCISTNNTKTNLQLLSHKEHCIKTINDFKILKKLRGLGFYEKVTNYSIELLKPQEEVIAKFIELKTGKTGKTRGFI